LISLDRTPDAVARWTNRARFFNILFVALLLNIIALTWIIARFEMIGLIQFIFHGILMLYDPWHATVVPASP
jgi:hypothetical protein